MKKTPKKYKSRIAETVHKTAKGLHCIGAMDETTMRGFDAMCSTANRQQPVGVARKRRTKNLQSDGLLDRGTAGDRRPAKDCDLPKLVAGRGDRGSQAPWQTHRHRPPAHDKGLRMTNGQMSAPSKVLVSNCVPATHSRLSMTSGL